jgi:hypothetical protein
MRVRCVAIGKTVVASFEEAGIGNAIAAARLQTIVMTAIVIGDVAIVAGFAFVGVDHAIAARFIGRAIGIATVAAFAIGVSANFVRARIDHTGAATNGDANFVKAKRVARGTEDAGRVVGTASTCFERLRGDTRALVTCGICWTFKIAARHQLRLNASSQDQRNQRE